MFEKINKDKASTDMRFQKYNKLFYLFKNLTLLLYFSWIIIFEPSWQPLCHHPKVAQLSYPIKLATTLLPVGRFPSKSQ